MAEGGKPLGREIGIKEGDILQLVDILNQEWGVKVTELTIHLENMVQMA